MQVNVNLPRSGSKIGVFASVNDLPNVPTSTSQTDTLDVGDNAWVSGGITPGMYVCIDRTIGSAQWSLIKRAPSGKLVALDSSIGIGNNNWQYAMGLEFHLTSPANITEQYAKIGSSGVGVGHAWQLRRSTVVGALPPPLSSYTDVVDGGTHTPAGAGWEAMGMAAPHAALLDEWYVAKVYVGVGGQNADINTLRTQGFLDERFAYLNSGVYVYLGQSNPGSVAPPTYRPTSTIYGITSVALSAP